METKVAKWGNSYAVRIPKEIIEKMQLRENSALYLNATHDSVIIKKKSRKDELLELLSSTSKEKPLFEDKPHGKEAW